MDLHSIPNMEQAVVDPRQSEYTLSPEQDHSLDDVESPEADGTEHTGEGYEVKDRSRGGGRGKEYERYEGIAEGLLRLDIPGTFAKEVKRSRLRALPETLLSECVFLHQRRRTMQGVSSDVVDGFEVVSSFTSFLSSLVCISA